MAKDKKSFVAYSDWKETFDNLSDEYAGKLIKHIFAYVNDESPISEDMVINAVFPNIMNSLKRDLVKWENQLEQRREAGKKSAEIRAAKSNERSIPLNETQRNSTVSVSVNESVNVNEIKEKKRVNKFTPPSLDLVIEYFIENGYSKESAERAFKYYETGEWRDSKNNPVKNWKQKMLSVWFKDENKIKSIPTTGTNQLTVRYND
jgi:hypothetical protein